MPSLKDFRDSIASVKSTKKITLAMKMVAASKLKKAQERAEASQPYAQSMAAVLTRVAANIVISPSLPKLLTGTGDDQRHLLVVVTSDRGLCGGFNGNLVRKARQVMAELQQAGKQVQIVTVGRKSRDLLKRDCAELIVKSFTGIGASKSGVGFDEANTVTQYVLNRFEAGEFDVCQLVTNNFVNVMVQQPSTRQIIPFRLPEVDQDNNDMAATTTPYDFEPDEETMLADLLPRNLSVQIYRALLDSAAGEQAARMTAMDAATRNAGDRINDLSLQYNRARQAHITKELIEIISGAEAV